MRELEVLTGELLEDSWLTLEQLADACAVEQQWLLNHLEAGLMPNAASIGGTWRFSNQCLSRARRMRQLERDFDAVPELAALVSDLIEELEVLRRRMR